jgi:uncharacterized protein YbaR (Trm112 family)
MSKDRTVYYKISDEPDDPRFEGPYADNQLRLFPQRTRRSATKLEQSTMVLLFICPSCKTLAQMFDAKDIFALSQYEHESETLLCPECSRNEVYPED